MYEKTSSNILASSRTSIILFQPKSKKLLLTFFLKYFVSIEPQTFYGVTPITWAGFSTTTSSYGQ